MRCTKQSKDYQDHAKKASLQGAQTQRVTLVNGISKAKITAEKIKFANSQIDENGLTGYQKAARKAVPKVRSSNEKAGYWMPLSEKNKFDQYRIAVSIEQRRFLSEIKLLPNFNRRAPSGTYDGYHLDHRISLWFGFMNNISPKIIGHICNLQMKPWLANNRKWSKCDLTLDELQNAIYEYEKVT